MTFDPSVQHKLYKLYKPKWERQEDCVEGGEDAVKAAGEKYLPMLTGQSQQVHNIYKVTPYSAYKMRASFLEAPGRTADTLVGGILRRSPLVYWPEDSVKELKFFTEDSEDVFSLFNDVAAKVVGIGRRVVLTDATPDGQVFAKSIDAKHVTNWRMGTTDGRRQPVMVTIRLPDSVIRDGQGKAKSLERYLVLRLGLPELSEEEAILHFADASGVVRLPRGAIYYQEIWEEYSSVKDSKSDRFFKKETIIPRKFGGSFITRIPVRFINCFSNTPDPSKILLEGICQLALSHYRNSADLEHGLHFTALPQPYLVNANIKGETLAIGSGVAWGLEGENVQVGYLEFTGQGLTSITQNMRAKERQMAALGARILEEKGEPGGTESAETLKRRTTGEYSALGRVSIHLSAGFTGVLQDWQMFKNVEENARVEVNRDFGLSDVPVDKLAVVFTDIVMQGGMSWNSFYQLLRRQDLVPESRSSAEERELIQVEQGSFTAAPDPQNPEDPQNPDQQQPRATGFNAEPNDLDMARGLTAVTQADLRMV